MAAWGHIGATRHSARQLHDRPARLAGRVVQFPVLVALASVDGAGIAAAHGDDELWIVDDGTQGTLYECPPRTGAHFGGVLLRWCEQGVVMAVSLHGPSELNRRLVMALAAHM